MAQIRKTVDASTGYPGKLRIIGGRWRGRQLSVVNSAGLRPTPDRVRETLFNWLRPWLPGARCVDLFAGTGALCLEALSQGAAEAVLVEKAAPVAENLRRNVAQLGAETVQVVEADAVDYLQGPVLAFDIVFVDPPFRHHDLVDACLCLLAERGWLRPGGWVYIEVPADLGKPRLPPGWELVRSKTAGQVGYHLARISKEAP